VKKKTARTPKPAKPAPTKRKVLPALAVEIEYPQEEERVLPGHYALRLRADGATEVQLRIDGKEWRPCRESLGYFWHDWSPEPPGRRVAEARARRGAKGRWVRSGPRSFEVVPA